MTKVKIILATAVTVGLTAASMAVLAPSTQSSAAVLTSEINQRMAVVHKMPQNPFVREVTESHCIAFSNCQDI